MPGRELPILQALKPAGWTSPRAARRAA